MVRLVAIFSAGAVVFAAPALAAGSADVAALQVALRTRSMYAGTIDGRAGPDTRHAVLAFQRAAGLTPDGIAGPLTRRALGSMGGPELGARELSFGTRGWDVAELQFLLAWHGFPSGTFDGVFGPHVQAAVRRFQRFAHVPQLGIVGPLTRAALSRPVPVCPLTLHRPVRGLVGDRFGPRGNRFHAGVDLQAPAGTPVHAARGGLVVYAAPRGSYGNAVLIAHGHGVRTLYAHLARVGVSLGQRVASGQQIGLVGATGEATGPHLHFEVRVRGAAVDPLPALARE